VFHIRLKFSKQTIAGGLNPVGLCDLRRSIAQRLPQARSGTRWNASYTIIIVIRDALQWNAFHRVPPTTARMALLPERGIHLHWVLIDRVPSSKDHAT
jgi:hypothetical protein